MRVGSEVGNDGLGMLLRIHYIVHQVDTTGAQIGWHFSLKRRTPYFALPRAAVCCLSLFRAGLAQAAHERDKFPAVVGGLAVGIIGSGHSGEANSVPNDEVDFAPSEGLAVKAVRELERVDRD